MTTIAQPIVLGEREVAIVPALVASADRRVRLFNRRCVGVLIALAVIWRVRVELHHVGAGRAGHGGDR